MRLLIGAALVALVSGNCPFFNRHSDGPLTEEQKALHVALGVGSDQLRCVHKEIQLGVPEITAKGCTCRSTCGASPDDLSNCDWCYTANNCGRSGLSGSWDYCVYPTKNESSSAVSKQTGLWSKVAANATSGSYPNVLSILTESVQTSFDLYRDTMPEGRVKYIHSVGAVCKFNLNVNPNSPYTGLFEKGSQIKGLIRMGSAKDVDTKSGLVPGIGIKMLRDNVASGNFVALVNLDPLPNNNYNFFAAPFSNHIPAASSFATKVLGTKFNQASTCISKVGLSDICTYNSAGTKAAAPVFPFKVKLYPLYNIPSAPMDLKTLQARLAAIPPGTSLFNVTAFGVPTPTSEIVLGTLVTNGACANSAFGDASLFFRHELIENDWQLKPSYMSAVNPQAECGTNSVTNVPPFQCNTRQAD